MRAFAGLLCLSAALTAAPAMAQAKDVAQPQSGPNNLTNAPKASEAPADAAKPNAFNFGFIDNLKIGRSTDRPAAGLAPIEKDELELNFRPGGKWGLTLDLTSRADNSVLPREEVAAGAYYQFTPRFRFGGGVALKSDSLSSSFASPEAWRQQDAEASVRLESAFSF